MNRLFYFVFFLQIMEPSLFYTSFFIGSLGFQGFLLVFCSPPPVFCVLRMQQIPWKSWSNPVFTRINLSFEPVPPLLWSWLMFSFLKVILLVNHGLSFILSPSILMKFFFYLILSLLLLYHTLSFSPPVSSMFSSCFRRGLFVLPLCIPLDMFPFL